MYMYAQIYFIDKNIRKTFNVVHCFQIQYENEIKHHSI